MIEMKGESFKKIYLDGCWLYYNKRGLEHRSGDLPAIDCKNGYQEWWENGKPHRTGGKPAEIDPKKGCKRWWVRGKLIKEEGNCGDYYKNCYVNGKIEW